MKTNIFFVVNFLILLQSVNSNAWDTAAAKYYPLNAGNVYIFYKYELRLGCYPQVFQQINKVYISGLETKPNGKQYYRFSGWWNENDLRANPFLNLQRIDSNSMNVYVYDSVSNSELLIDSLMANTGNRFNCNRLTSVMPNGIYDFIQQENFLGALRNIKQFQCTGQGLVAYHYNLAEGIGFSEITSCELGAGSGYFLKGCVINGAVYGDTSFINVSDFFPLKIGNVWSYNWTYNGNPPGGGIVNVYVTKDTLIGLRKYYLCNFPGLPQWLRMDSASGKIYSLSAGGGCFYHQGEILVDSLYSKKGDSTNFCSSVRRVCADTGIVQIFGNSFQKNFNPLLVLTASARNYAKNIGMYFISEGDPFPTEYTLRGCYINGILYGDTTMTSVLQTGNSIPDKYSLSQNYPNPFNPVTVIHYSIPSGGNKVKLSVYNNLGKEIQTLVNEKQHAGSYSVNFNGEGLPSGIYFYRLEAGDFSETKRMILIK
ncbi:MAG: T9SS type A sorting domain-containing protein [Ignavibacteria bacterium]|nr:T9SS type A sorting domain-containing protein [Ignavibacteria bacterium]